MLETWVGNKAAMSYIGDLCGRIEDRDKVVEILQEFNNRNSGKLVACLSGHTHMDSIWEPYETVGKCRNPLPCYQMATRGVCIPECDHIQFGISIDIVVWTPSENEFHLIRVGDGENRRVKGRLA